MSNIYNLQQVSTNSRIVAVEGTFDHIDANNMNVTTVTTDNMTITGLLTKKDLSVTDGAFITQLQVDKLGAISGPGGHVQMFDDSQIDPGKEIRVDTISENTALNSVHFPPNLKTDLIEGIAAVDVDI